MATVRAKFRCQIENTRKHGPQPEASTRVYEFFAVFDDGTPENARYAKHTPTAKLEMTVDNPAVSFEPGKSYYLDITPAED